MTTATADPLDEVRTILARVSDGPGFGSCIPCSVYWAVRGPRIRREIHARADRPARVYSLRLRFLTGLHDRHLAGLPFTTDLVGRPPARADERTHQSRDDATTGVHPVGVRDAGACTSGPLPTSAVTTSITVPRSSRERAGHPPP